MTLLMDIVLEIFPVPLDSILMESNVSLVHLIVLNVNPKPFVTLVLMASSLKS